MAELKTHKTALHKAIELSVIALLFLAICTTLYRAWFSRYMADDYCISAGVNVSNLIEFVRINYQNWSGRFSCFIHAWLFSQFGPSSFGLILTTLIIIWILLLTTLFLKLNVRFKLELAKKHALILALVIVLVTIETSPSKFQSFLWRDGFIHHSLPMIWMTLAAVSFLQLSKLTQSPRWYSYPILFLIVLISGGFSETSSISFVTLYSLAYGISLISGQKVINDSEKRFLFIALLAALSALLIEYASPGNSIRRSLLPMESQNLFQVVGFSIRNVIFFVGKYLVYSPHMAILAIGAGYFVLGHYNKSIGSTKTFILALIGLISTLTILLVSIALPVVLLIHAYPDDRVLAIANFYITVILVSSGFLLNRWINHLTACKEIKFMQQLQRGVLFGLIVLIILNTLLLGKQLTSDNQMLFDYANRWDQREAKIIQLKSIGETILIVPGLESRDLVADISLDPEDWVNSCMAAYYGVEKIIGK